MELTSSKQMLLSPANFLLPFFSPDLLRSSELFYIAAELEMLYHIEEMVLAQTSVNRHWMNFNTKRFPIWGILLSPELPPTAEGFPFTILENVHCVSQNKLNKNSNPHNKTFFPRPPTDDNNDLGLGNKEKTSFYP